MPRLIEHQIEFVAYALGKPKALYPDESLRNGHKKGGIPGVREGLRPISTRSCQYPPERAVTFQCRT